MCDKLPGNPQKTKHSDLTFTCFTVAQLLPSGELLLIYTAEGELSQDYHGYNTLPV